MKENKKNANNHYPIPQKYLNFNIIPPEDNVIFNKRPEIKKAISFYSYDSIRSAYGSLQPMYYDDINREPELSDNDSMNKIMRDNLSNGVDTTGFVYDYDWYKMISDFCNDDPLIVEYYRDFINSMYNNIRSINNSIISNTIDTIIINNLINAISNFIGFSNISKLDPLVYKIDLNSIVVIAMDKFKESQINYTSFSRLIIGHIANVQKIIHRTNNIDEKKIDIIEIFDMGILTPLLRNNSYCIYNIMLSNFLAPIMSNISIVDSNIDTTFYYDIFNKCMRVAMDLIEAGIRNCVFYSILYIDNEVISLIDNRKDRIYYDDDEF